MACGHGKPRAPLVEDARGGGHVGLLLSDSGGFLVGGLQGVVVGGGLSVRGGIQLPLGLGVIHVVERVQRLEGSRLAGDLLGLLEGLLVLELDLLLLILSAIVRAGCSGGSQDMSHYFGLGVQILVLGSAFQVGSLRHRRHCSSKRCLLLLLLLLL